MTVQTSDLQAQTLKTLGINSDETVLQERALNWLNEALDDVQMYIPDAEFLQVAEMPVTLVVSRATYVLPTDFMVLTQFRNDTESTILNFITRAEFDRRHPDPSTEGDATPSDVTLEYDRQSGRHVVRVGPAPVAADTCYVIMKRWHPALSASQDIQWDKLKHVLIRRAAYYGSLEIYQDNEYVQMRNELNTVSLNKIQALQGVLAMQKPRPNQIPVVLRKSDY